MPLYDFRCTDCSSEREAIVPFDKADSLELICVDCGGDMTRKLNKSFAIVMGVSQPALPSPAGPPRRKGHTCSEGAVRLTEKNPFAAALSSTTGAGQADS